MNFFEVKYEEFCCGKCYSAFGKSLINLENIKCVNVDDSAAYIYFEEEFFITISIKEYNRIEHILKGELTDREISAILRMVP